MQCSVNIAKGYGSVQGVYQRCIVQKSLLFAHVL